ncbi:unnamed protein product [Angiostrongylus costaricensis]|uniref:SUEL-type lectin domain-containing protein n=1 Tax=Angiostrongylus costaricensis TaxID=334426 RepID=A0A0R3PYQ4_ANGCS|nr:unnamed protein product [Angiostrongylus costaricensis]
MMDPSLRSHRVQACDGEKVTLHCPRNTHIIIETGFYGRVVPESQLCPGRIPGRKGYDATCDVIQAKSRLSELCDKKRKCTIYVDTTAFEDDPCPTTSKYLQMSYKCRPVLFDGESFCEGAEMHLECREGRRLAIYSANYGRSARTQAAHCTAPVHFTKECTRDVLSPLLSKCHAQPGCSVPVTDEMFGSPCPPDVPSYLSILFMCGNETQAASTVGVSVDDKWERLTEKHIESDAKPSASQTIPTRPQPMFNNDAGYVTEDRYSFSSSQDNNLDLQSDERTEQTAHVDKNLIGIAHDIMLVVTFIKQNKEKALVCTILSASLALILLLIACILHQFCGGRRKHKRVPYSIERSQLIAKCNPSSGNQSLTRCECLSLFLQVMKRDNYDDENDGDDDDDDDGDDDHDNDNDDDDLIPLLKWLSKNAIE